jgi:hypothetical protein
MNTEFQNFTCSSRDRAGSGKVLMPNLFVQEEVVDATQHIMFGSDDVYESFTDDAGELFRKCREAHGRCISKAYVDENGSRKHIGWVFQKRDRYSDTGEPYLRETWVTVHSGPPTKTVEYHTVDLGR